MPTAALKLSVIWSLLSFFSPDTGSMEAYRLVVHPSNPVDQMRAPDVARAFLKRVQKWDDGTPVQPVDQSFTSALRIRFAREVLGRTPGELQEYWLRQTFSGREVPPLVRESDRAVLEYVSATPGAIGYVSIAVPLPAGVKPVRVVP